MTVLNEERDLIHVISSLTMIRSKLDMLEQRMEEESNHSQNVYERQNIAAPSKMQSIKQTNMVGKNIPVKSHYNNMVAQQPNQYPMQGKPPMKNGSISEILDNYDKRPRLQEEGKSINNIIGEIYFPNI